MTDFRRYAWGEIDQRMSVPTKKALMRISLVLAFDNHGNVYFSLSDHNSNSDTFSLFMQHLAKALDADRPGWRQNTIILLDNASYHKSTATIEVLEALILPVMYSGPYSFNIAPCELLFSLLKRDVINPNDLPLGKRYVLSHHS